MRITFDDKSFVEIRKTQTGKIMLSLGAKSNNKLSVSSAEISLDQFLELAKSVSDNVEAEVVEPNKDT